MTNSQPVAIITAAGHGMGAAIAKELHGRGYKLSMMTRSEGAEKLASDLGGLGLRGSVGEAEDLKKLVDATLEKFGRIDAVVGNTGAAAKKPLLELTDEDWKEGFDLLFLYVARLARLVVPVMSQQGGGAFVNISTFAAFEPSPVFPVSGTIRAALGAYAKLFSDEFAAQNIRMNNILPGFIDTKGVKEKFLAQIPAGRYGTVEEIAKTAAFLLSDDARYITGQNIKVDGGVTHAI